MYNNGMYDYGSYEQTVSMYTTLTAYMGILSAISLITCIISIVSMWKIFSANGELGWKALIPGYNIYILLKIVNLPAWYLILYLIPFVNIFALYKVCKGLADLYGKSTIFAILCMFLPFVCYPILAFGSSSISVNSSVVNLNEQPQMMNPNMNEPIETNVIVGQNESIMSTEVNRTLQSNDSSILMSQTTSLNTEPTVVQPMETTFEQQQAGETNVAVNIPTQQTTSVTIPTVPVEDRVCPSCGSKVGTDAKVCFMCGTRI